MYSIQRILIFLSVFVAGIVQCLAQGQDKEQSKLYMEQAELMMAETKAMDDARDLMITAANYDTTSIVANFEAGHMHLLTVGKDRATKYFLRIYRQDPSYRFDLEYWIGKSYQYGLEFDKALNFYNQYLQKLKNKPDYKGNDLIELKEVERRIVECNNGKEFVAHPKNFSIVNLGREVNSEYEDYAPVLNEDENELVFTTRRRDNNLNENVSDDNKPFEDIFYASKGGGNWKRASNMGNRVNTPFNDSNLALSPDGSTLFIYKDEGQGDIYFSTRQKDGSWNAPEPLPGEINSSFRETSMSITKDGKTIYFASDRPGGLGGSDIYVSTKNPNGEWGKIKNLGPSINTESDEDAPFIDYDTKTLFFSSYARKGMGGADIFKSTLKDQSKNEWTEPENLGYPINTPDDDIFYVSTKDGERGYFSSVREGGMGYTDIYIITTPEEPKKAPAAKETKPLKYVVTVVDATSKKPLSAKIKLQGLKDNVVVGSSQEGEGVYAFSITSTTKKDYQLSVEAEGYIFENSTVSIASATADEQTVTRTVEMKKLKVGAVSVLRNIYFDFEKATFRSESYGELNKLETMMKQNDRVQVEISGHTDNIGGTAFNKQLSLKRANAVKNFLSSKGIDPRRVTAAGYGEEKPLASNDDELEGRELNRRVEFKVLGN